MFTIESLCRALRIPNSKLGVGWRIIPQSFGEINGIPTLRGKRVATDGILCIILVGDNDYIIGHNEWFVKDVDVSAPSEKKESFGRRMQRVRKEKDLEVFNGLLE